MSAVPFENVIKVKLIFENFGLKMGLKMRAETAPKHT